MRQQTASVLFCDLPGDSDSLTSSFANSSAASLSKRALSFRALVACSVLSFRMCPCLSADAVALLPDLEGIRPFARTLLAHPL
jgi:hypothetical protein